MIKLWNLLLTLNLSTTSWIMNWSTRKRIPEGITKPKLKLKLKCATTHPQEVWVIHVTVQSYQEICCVSNEQFMFTMNKLKSIRTIIQMDCTEKGWERECLKLHIHHFYTKQIITQEMCAGENHLMCLLLKLTRLEFKLKIHGRGRFHYNKEYKIYWEQNRMIHVRWHILSMWSYIPQFSMTNWGWWSRCSILGCDTRTCL